VISLLAVRRRGGHFHPFIGHSILATADCGGQTAL
jgi:hypothetical protein